LFGALNLAETFDPDMKLMYGILRTRRTENVWAVFFFLGGGTFDSRFLKLPSTLPKMSLEITYQGCEAHYTDDDKE
jgi:hypothetical protein